MRKALGWAGLLLYAVSGAASAQEAKQPWEEYEKLIQSKKVVTTLGPTLLGDEINLENGGLSFSNTDISVPGNNALPVEIKRTFTAGNRKGYSANDYSFADWELDIPRLSGTFAQNWPDTRCAVTTLSAARPPTIQLGAKYLRPEDYWQGNQAHMSGGGAMMLVKPGNTVPTTGSTYYWMTSAQTHFSCLPTIQNGSGQGFLAITSDGTRYWFDWMARYYEPRIKGKTSNGQDVYLERRKNVLYATRVEDRFGNWVTYSYSNAFNAPIRLNTINASDGRQISLAYNAQGFVSSVTAHSQTWTYQYSSASLSAVVLPDASQWSVNFSELSSALIRYYEAPAGSQEAVRSCMDPGDVISSGKSGTITHPSGAVGEFRIEPIRHGRSNVPLVCDNLTLVNGVITKENDDVAYYPLNYDSMTLTSKKITGPGLVPAVWQYNYSPTITGFLHPSGNGYPICTSGDCSAPQCLSDSCAGTQVTEVAGPDGEYKRYTFGNSYRYNEGKLLKVESGSIAGSVYNINSARTILKTEATSYELAQSGQAYPTPVGLGTHPRGDVFTSEYIRPKKTNVVTLDGANFNLTVNGFDSFANPTSVTKSSSLGFSRTETTVYENSLSKWVLGQAKKITASNANSTVVTSETTYDPTTLLPTHFYGPHTLAVPQGKLLQTLTYNSNGTVATVKDGNNNVTTLSGWKRGIPGVIQHPVTDEAPSGAIESAGINDSGWIEWVVDELGNRNCYGYDAMGRLSRITYTSEATVGVCNTSAWNETLLQFEKVAATEYGIPANHWRQTITTGNAKKINYFDAFWRPLVTREYDAGNVAATQRFTRFAYDFNGKVAFASYPGTTDALSTGVWSFYDSLDRPISVQQDSELGPLVTGTTYLPGFQTRTTNPRNMQTTNGYQAYDQPTYDLLTWSVHPEGKVVEIGRDTLLGSPTQIRQRNTNGSLQQTRYYSYDDYLQLCKSTEPETASTLMGYDGGGNLIYSSAGLPGNPICDPTGTSPLVAASKAVRTYDPRNRVKTLSFPDGKGNQVWAYKADGLPASITTNNVSGGDQVVNAYTYNNRRMLVGESSAQPGWYSWGIGYGYDANASLSALTYPTGLSVSYAPNALGQATQAGSYATGVQYYPNGAIKQFTYGNGIVHTMTQNARQLPYDSVDSGGVLYDRYSYDNNGNVASVIDYKLGSGYSVNSRWMTYDGLDRLTGAGAGMFGGTDNWHRFTYDALDNMTSWKLAGVKDYATYSYEPGTNRLGLIQNSAGAGIVGFGYDPQGNLANKNGQSYDFDYGNRLRATNGVEWLYRYDGHGRRVLSGRADGITVSQYSQSGQLLYYEQTSKGNFEHIYLAGSLLAIRNSGVIRFQHTDALGSPVAVTDTAGNVIERNNYEHYGGIIGKPAYDGLGFTGHKQDAATGLTYMQQRYYDPGIGRFLSVDPVTANSGTGANFNRYWYANNNPYKFTDPDGRLVEYRFSDGATIGDGAAVLNHLMKSETIMGEMSQILNSDETYTVAFNRGGDFVYDIETRTINIDVTSGLRVGSSGEIQSPALGGGHEISHAAEHDRIGTEAFEKASTPPQTGGLENGVMKVRVGTSREEARATKVESKAAKELGEPARGNYKDQSGPVKVCSPTSNKAC